MRHIRSISILAGFFSISGVMIPGALLAEEECPLASSRKVLSVDMGELRGLENSLRPASATGRFALFYQLAHGEIDWCSARPDTRKLLKEIALELRENVEPPQIPRKLVTEAQIRGGEVLLTFEPNVTEADFYTALMSFFSFEAADVPLVMELFPLKDDVLLPSIPLHGPLWSRSETDGQTIPADRSTNADDHGPHVSGSENNAPEAGPMTSICPAYPGTIASDPQFLSQEGLHISCFPQAWNHQRGKDSVVVAIIDSGLDPHQADINLASLLPGKNFCEGCSLTQRLSASDETGHGTAVSGIVGAGTSEAWRQGLRIAGSNWHVRLIPLKFLQDDNLGSPNDAAAAICHAADHGADVILAAWGGFGCDSTDLRNAIGHAEEKEVLFVTAAGNDGLNLDDELKKFYPAYYERYFDNVLVVGATDRDDDREEYSNYGTDTVHIGAPGVRTPVLGPERTHPVWPGSGTSVAAAYVAGAAALVFAELIDSGIADPSYLKVKECLLHSAAPRDLPWESRGRLDAYQAVKKVADGCPAAPP